MITTNAPGIPMFVYTMEISYGDGATDTTYCDSLGTASRCHTYAAAGSYTIKAVLLNGSHSRIDSSTYTQTVGECSMMYGYLYHDVNTNCTFDGGTDYYYYGTAKIKVDSAGTPVDTIDAWSYFQYKALGIGKSYTFTVLSTSLAGLTATCPTGGTFTATSGSAYMSAGNFGLQCSSSSSYDVAVHGTAVGSPYRYYAHGYLTNSSCTAKSGTFTINFDSRYNTVLWSYPTSGTVSGSSISWSYSGLDVDHPIYYSVYMSADSATPATIGSSLVTTMDLTPTSGDADTSNNHWTCTDTVKLSWDPNEKSVSPSGNVLAGTNLTYTLKFENTGNAPAKNIHILDTLAGTLDVNSIQIITSTHPMTYTSKVAGGKTILKFDFANINLPDSSHHGQADGFVMFSIKTKAGLVNGTNIDNNASIYFDVNKPVLTNTARVTINPVAVPKVSTSQVSLYPNPVHDDFTIKANTNEYNSVSVINAMGQTMLQQSLQPNETHINTHSLVPGVYFIMLRGNSGIKVEKIEKL